MGVVVHPTMPQREPLHFVSSMVMGPLAIRARVFRHLGGFNTTYSPPGLPGIHFERELTARLWLGGFAAATACMSKQTRFLNGCAGQGTSTSKAARQVRWQQAAFNEALLRQTFGGDVEERIAQLALAAQARLAANGRLLHRLRNLLPNCLNCTARPNAVRRLWSHHDERLCADFAQRREPSQPASERSRSRR